MPRPGEKIAADTLFLVPEWAVLDGRCSTCRHTMARRGKNTLRCDEHDVPIKLDFSCDSYQPAPGLVRARRQARSGRATCREAL